MEAEDEDWNNLIDASQMEAEDEGRHNLIIHIIHMAKSDQTLN